MKTKMLDHIEAFFWGAVILTFLVVVSIMNLTPPVTRDALIHHLAIPKLWLNHGGFYETPWADFSYYPMNINLLYLVCLYLKNDIAPKFIHFFFGLGTGWLIYTYLNKRFNRKWGLLGMAIFTTTPIVIWLSTTAYIDLGMAFFTTASMLAFIKWRDSGYQFYRWLIISSCCMGIAVGSKYNALIAWFILNLMLMLIYVRDTKGQLSSIKYGLIFFFITLIVASPWYAKNFILTGNPFYPLFNSFFNYWSHHSIQEIVQLQEVAQKVIAGKSSKVGFFQLREILYGENFWETLLIPLRMFFQGDDNSYQYFQGRLNPILIVFIPFIFLKKHLGKDKLLFIIFSIWFISIAYFLTAKQVRYILPVLPMLSILAVIGIKNVSDRLKKDTFLSPSCHANKIKLCLRLMLSVTVIILLIPNVLYLEERFEMIKPLPYILKQESKEAFLKHHLLHYHAMKYINTNLPKDAVIFTVLFGRRGYYFERSYKNEPYFGSQTLTRWVKSSMDEDKFYKSVKSIGATHIVMRTDLLERYLKNNFSKIEITRFMDLVKKKWRLLYHQNGYSIWEV